MPNKFALSIISIGLPIFCGLLSLTAYLTNYMQTEESKSISLKPKYESLIRTAKLQPPFELKLNNDNFQVAQINNTFSVAAILSTHEHLQELNYMWIVPEGVRLQDPSQRTGKLLDLSPRFPVTIQAEFLNLTEENQVVSLRVWRDHAQGTLARTVQYNTVEQLEVDLAYKDLAQKNEEYLNQLNLSPREASR